MKNFIFLAVLILIFSCSHYQKNKPSYNATLDNYSYPFKVERIRIKSQSQDLTMAYMYLKNATKNSQTVLLLHGKNFAGFYWEKTAQLLHEKGYNVLIPDQIGFGKSSKPTHYQYSFSNLALNTMTLIKELNIKNITIVGHSMGGMLAVKFNKIYPTIVNKLILINPIGLEDYLLYTEFKDTNFFYKNEINKTEEKIRNYQIQNYYDGKWNERYEDLIKFSIGQLNHSDYPLVAWNNALLYGPIFSEPIVDDFKSIKNEVILILGTRDRTGPGRGFMKSGIKYKLGEYNQFVKKYKKIILKGKVIPLEGLGHMPQFEDFDRFKKVFAKEF